MLNRLVYKQLSNLILYLYSEIDEDTRSKTNQDLQPANITRKFKTMLIHSVTAAICIENIKKRTIQVDTHTPRQSRINNQTMLLTPS